MDPSDHLRPLLDGVGCTVCGARVPAEKVRILAHRDDLAFVELDCPSCGSSTLGLVLAPLDPDGEPILDVAPTSELTPADEARFASATPVSSDDVHAVRDFLAGWDGDLVGLLGRDDDPGDRSERRPRA
ncbi:MAG: hypothetical protein ACJ761_09925 [Chloroflexota bacterium]